MSATSKHPAVDEFLAAIERAAIMSCQAWKRDVHLDATVPNWRFSIDGVDAVREEYAKWFAHPAGFDDLRRLPTGSGEVVEYVLAWTENGIAHAGHHVHIIEVDSGLISRDTVMCGGRWPADLLAEMGGAGQGSA